MYRTRNALEILDRMVRDDPKMRRMIAVAEVNCQVGQLVYDARTSAELTQGQLARRMGTTQSVISRIEDADYQGHSLQLLRKVADALDLTLELRFVPQARTRRRSGT
jgi:ribosome-binding protein aMBF1 (putative translation factor)